MKKNAVLLIFVLVGIFSTSCANRELRLEREYMYNAQLAQNLTFGIAQETEYQDQGDPEGLVKVARVQYKDGSVGYQKVYHVAMVNYGPWRYTVKIFNEPSGLLVQSHEIGGKGQVRTFLPPGIYKAVLYTEGKEKGADTIEVNPRIIKTADGQKTYGRFSIDANYRY